MMGHRAPPADVEVSCRDLPYADDVTSLVSAGYLAAAREAAWQNALALKEALGLLGLRLNADKARCVLFDPYTLPGGIFQRMPHMRPISTAARVQDRLGREARRDAEIRYPEDGTGGPRGALEEHQGEGPGEVSSPYRLQ